MSDANRTAFSNTDIVVVLAAGLGSRLGSEENLPKPLRPVAGRALVLRVLDRFNEAGISHAVIVLGHRGEETRRQIVDADTDISLTFVTNPRYRLGNGLSVLAAKDAVGKQSFFLSMADHVFDTEIITGLRSAHLPENGLLLAVDKKMETIFDMDDATKVATEAGRIKRIGKTLEGFDAIDSGVFRCTPALFNAIAVKSGMREDGDCSLSEGVETLAQKGLALVYDIGDARWQDVDTKETEAHAEKVFG
jgi:1L-myo-inositol 1-phosphate cytidylyltransferase